MKKIIIFTLLFILSNLNSTANIEQRRIYRETSFIKRIELGGYKSYGGYNFDKVTVDYYTLFEANPKIRSAPTPSRYHKILRYSLNGPFIYHLTNYYFADVEALRGGRNLFTCSYSTLFTYRTGTSITGGYSTTRSITDSASVIVNDQTDNDDDDDE